MLLLMVIVSFYMLATFKAMPAIDYVWEILLVCEYENIFINISCAYNTLYNERYQFGRNRSRLAYHHLKHTTRREANYYEHTFLQILRQKITLILQACELTYLSSTRGALH